ncbi:MAG: hypothetical protein K2Z81_21195 [Cyanobacteria bacterium]|nr:hypothetical protein [Cyanobacteriota bacterium]
MLPPKEVPQDLAHPEYFKLRMRYETLGWPKQLATCVRLIVEKAPPSPEILTEENQRRLTLLMKGAEQLIFATELQNELVNATSNFIGLGLSKADQLTEKFEPMKQAKSGIMSAFSVFTKTVQDTVDSTLEKHVMPALGMPLDEIPPGKTPEEYLTIAERYEKIGLAEPTRKILKHIRASFPDSRAAITASLRLKTRVPIQEVKQDAQRIYLHAVRDGLLTNRVASKDAYEELLRDYPEFEWPYANLSCIVLKEGDLERATDLVNKALSINQASLRAWSCMARINLVEWKLDLLKRNAEKMDKLEPGNSYVQAYNGIIEFIETNNLDQ